MIHIMFFSYIYILYNNVSESINRSIVSLFSAEGVFKFISAVCFFVGLFFTFLGHHVSRVEKMFPIFFIGTVIGYAIEGMYIYIYVFIIFPILLVIQFFALKKFNKIIKKQL